jgi:hypothetical protein
MQMGTRMGLLLLLPPTAYMKISRSEALLILEKVKPFSFSFVIGECHAQIVYCTVDKDILLSSNLYSLSTILYFPAFLVPEQEQITPRPMYNIQFSPETC